MIEQFLVVDDGVVVYGKYDEERKANRAMKQFSEAFPGIKFYVYRSVSAFYTPTNEEVEAVKQGKQFWS